MFPAGVSHHIFDVRMFIEQPLSGSSFDHSWLYSTPIPVLYKRYNPPTSKSLTAPKASLQYLDNVKIPFFLLPHFQFRNLPKTVRKFTHLLLCFDRGFNKRSPNFSKLKTFLSIANWKVFLTKSKSKKLF